MFNVDSDDVYFLRITATDTLPVYYNINSDTIDSITDDDLVMFRPAPLPQAVKAPPTPFLRCLTTMGRVLSMSPRSGPSAALRPTPPIRRQGP